MNQDNKTSLSIETVRHIANLARLALSSEEEVIFQKELEKVLNAFHILTQVPIANEISDSRSAFLFEDMQSTKKELTEQISHMSSDLPNNSLSTKTFMAQVPESEGVFVRVPVILNQ